MKEASEMMRFVVFALVLASASFAEAAPQLPLAPFGLAMGSSLDSAKAKLPTHKAAPAPMNKTQTQLIGGPLAMYGETFTVNHTFDASGKLVAVFALVNTPKGDFEVCKKHWANVAAGVQAEFGAPDENKSDLDAEMPSQSLKYAFADGETLQASLVACMMIVSYKK
jgi:hypothetical protein